MTIRWIALTLLAACAGPSEEEPPSRGGGGGEITDYGIPSDYPQLNSRYSSHALWRRDGSGAEIVPNRWVSSIDELPLSEGAETYGAIWDPSYGSFNITFHDADADQMIEIYLPRLEVGTHQVDGFNGELIYTERGGYRYISNIEGGRGEVVIEGSNGKAFWGTFSGRTCFVQTPGVNCWSIYEGRWSAADERPE